MTSSVDLERKIFFLRQAQEVYTRQLTRTTLTLEIVVQQNIKCVAAHDHKLIMFWLKINENYAKVQLFLVPAS